MTITPIIGTGVNRARAICDKCGREEVLTCGYEKGGTTNRPARPKEGQIIRKLQGCGWSLVKGSLYCPSCEAKRKHSPDEAIMDEIAEKGAHMSTKSAIKACVVDTLALRQPTQDQRGDIIEMLVASYDRRAKRYIGNDTDKTIADAVGGGCLPGWVAEIRESNFSPAGGNEEIDAIRAEIVAVGAEFAAKVVALNKRIDAVCAAVGPKAARV